VDEIVMADDDPTEAPGVLQFRADGSPMDTVDWTPTFEFLRANTSNWLTFQPSGIKIELATGEVVIPEGLTLTDAARAFWDAVACFRQPDFW
jgi:hypothetical protein